MVMDMQVINSDRNRPNRSREPYVDMPGSLLYGLKLGKSRRKFLNTWVPMYLAILRLG